MGRFVTADLEERMKELASRVESDFENMTPLQKNDYLLCRGIEHLIWAEACRAPTSVVDIASYRPEDLSGLVQEVATGEALFEDAKVLAFRKSA